MSFLQKTILILMKFGYFTDSHVRGDSPEGRTDDYRLSMLTKLEEIGQIWIDKGVDAILFGGDLFHTPDPVTSVKYDLMNVLKGWSRYQEIFGVIGSHDYFGYQIKSLKRTAIGLFERAGIIHLIGSEGFPKYLDFTLPEGLCRVVGTPHTYWLCEDPKNFFEPKDPEVDFQIQLVHGDLIDKPVLWQHVLCKEAPTKSDLVLIGHYHPGWKTPLRTNNSLYVNPGSIGRLENTGVQRTPRVCIIDTQTRDVEFVELSSCAQHPFKEKLATSEEPNIMQDVAKLLSLIETTSIDTINIKEQLPVVAKELGLADAVLDKAFEILETIEN